jgi:glycosyltransferase involved in cell wall biosynthesis
VPGAGLSVLHVDTAGTWRGGQAQVLGLCEGLAARGVTQWLAAPDGPLAARARERGIEAFRFAPRGDLDLPAAWGLARLALRLRPRILHLHSARAHATGWPAARAARAKVVVARRVDFAVAANPLSALKYRLPVDRFVTVSGGIKDVLLQGGVPPARVTVIHSGIEVDRVAASVAEARASGRARAFRAALGVPEAAPLLGVIAAFAPHKDHATFVRAARRVLDRRPDAWFVCAGEGETLAAVRAEAHALGLSERLRLPGFVHDVPALLGALDLFVLSSFLEGLGTSVLDAQAAGVPVVATRVGGVPEMITSGVDGLLVPARDPEALAAAMLDVLADPEAARARARAAHASVRAFDLGATVAATERLYRELLP